MKPSHTTPTRLAAAARFLVGGAAVLLWLSAAQADDLRPIAIVEPARTEPVAFEREALPLLAAHCLACHSGARAENALVLDSPAAMRKGGAAGPALVPGRGAESLLLKAAAHQLEPIMPPAGNTVGATSLTSAELGLIQRWIDEGAAGDTARSAEPIGWQAMPARVQPILAAALLGDGELLAVGRGNQIVLYTVTTGQPIAPGQAVATLTDPALAGQLNPTHSPAAPPSPRAAGGRVRGRRADRAAAPPIATRPPLLPAAPPPPAAHLDLVQSLAAHPDGTLLASGGFREVKLWRRAASDATGGAWTLERTIGQADRADLLVGRVTALAFSRDGSLLAVGSGEPARGGELKLFRSTDGQLVRTIFEPHSDTVGSLQFSPDGAALASASSDRLAKIWSVDSGSLLKSLEGHGGPVHAVAWQADGKRLATGAGDGVIKIWEVETGEAKRTINASSKEIAALAFVDKSPKLLAAGGDGLRLLNADNGQTERRYQGSSDFLHTLQITPDSKRVLAAGQESTIFDWQISDGKLVRKIEK